MSLKFLNMLTKRLNLGYDAVHQKEEKKQQLQKLIRNKWKHFTSAPR